jgi:hypothetical protein
MKSFVKPRPDACETAFRPGICRCHQTPADKDGICPPRTQRSSPRSSYSYS